LCVILEEDVPQKYYLSQNRLSYYLENTKKMAERNIGYKFMLKKESEKAFTITTKEGNRIENNFIYQPTRGYNDGGEFHEKSPTLTANSWQENNLLVRCCALRGREKGTKIEQMLEIRDDEKSGALTLTHKNNMIITKIDVKGKTKKNQEKASCFTAGGHSGGNHSDMDLLKITDGSEKTTIRRLTPLECRRLQGIPDWYKFNCSDSQIYKMLGNGWQIDQIKIFFQYLK